MDFPRFFLGMVMASAAVAAWAYAATGSAWMTLAWTALGATMLQVGYFALLVKMVYAPGSTEGGGRGSPSAASRHIGVSTVVAIGVVATIVMTVMARADDDAYFDCVIGKAEAIMKTQARKDAEAALSKAYALCQSAGTTRLARINGTSPLPHRAAPLYPLVNS
ncbi:hypothetical protein [Mesorhizobium sp. ES1-1]|uniref:hypothetical protein n=1 Tax=Mesorhizobium sp. ES1-1 TaxID=2876629 RepID=UPI001CCE6C5E|nr:hypothetical protein [Mesorhizobium sp. ES1-1]MBZ9678221.1 hypothetical protein [Mesorhizobium sp. ES1-1]